MLLPSAPRIAFLGAGATAHAYAQVFSLLGSKITAVHTPSISSTTLQEFIAKYNCTYVPQPDCLFDTNIADLVFVAIPWLQQVKLFPSLLSHSTPTLFEKPISLDKLHLYELISESGSPVANKFVAFNRRFFESVKQLRSLLRADDSLRFVNIRISEDPARLLNRHGPQICNHFLAHSSCHLLDLFCFLFPDYHLHSVSRRPYVHDSYVFTDIYATGTIFRSVPVQLSIQFNDPSPIGIECSFASGLRCHLSPTEQLHVYKGYDIAEPSSFSSVRSYQPHLLTSTLTETLYRPGTLSLAKSLLDNTLDDLATIHDSLKLLELIDLLRFG